jgi:hypothetical protein
MNTPKRTPKLISPSAYPLILITGFILSFLSAFSHAQNEGRWYNVEILIFKRLDQNSQSQEIWRTDLALAYPHFYEYLRAPSAEAKSQLGALNNDLYVLSRYRDALARNENFKILTHMAWSQQMANEAESPAIIISDGEEIGNHQELEGYIKIHIARFLHVTSNLWLTDTSADTVDPTIKWPALPPEPSRTKAGMLKPTNIQAGNLPQTASSTGVLNEINRGFNTNYSSPYPIITLQNKRRMRSNELHYVDHPAMGILIFMTPIEDT